MGTSNLTEKHVKNAKELAITDHLLQCDSPITFDDFDISVSDSNQFKLLIKETLIIERDKTDLNTMIKSFPLDLFFLTRYFLFIKNTIGFQYLTGSKNILLKYKYITIGFKYNVRMNRSIILSKTYVLRMLLL